MSEDGLHVVFGTGQVGLALATRLAERGIAVRAVSRRRPATLAAGVDWRAADAAVHRNFGWHPFGGEITGYRVFDGLSIPNAGRIGWNFGTDHWSEGEFFRFEITQLRRLDPLSHRQ